MHKTLSDAWKYSIRRARFSRFDPLSGTLAQNGGLRSCSRSKSCRSLPGSRLKRDRRSPIQASREVRVVLVRSFVRGLPDSHLFVEFGFRAATQAAAALSRSPKHGFGSFLRSPAGLRYLHSRAAELWLHFGLGRSLFRTLLLQFVGAGERLVGNELCLHRKQRVGFSGSASSAQSSWGQQQSRAIEPECAEYK